MAISFKQFLIEAADISSIVHKVIKKSGFSADANCSGGRCYEFRDALHAELKKHGINATKTDSTSWVQEHSKKLKQSVGWSESAALSDRNHAWVVHNGRHYDALTPSGAESPRHMTYFKKHMKAYVPDEEQRSYHESKHGKKYNEKTDRFE